MTGVLPGPGYRPDVLDEPRSAGRTARRVLRITASAAACIVVGWAVWAYEVLGHPDLDSPTPADAVVVLGPANENDSIDVGISLVDRGLARTLLVSTVPEQRGWIGGLCSGNLPGPKTGTLTCFVPEPRTTRGEARTVADLARRHQWHHVILVTSTYHVERSRLLFERCFPGTVQLVSPTVDIGASRWAFQAVYQSAAFVKAAVDGGC